MIGSDKKNTANVKIYKKDGTFYLGDPVTKTVIRFFCEKRRDMDYYVMCAENKFDDRVIKNGKGEEIERRLKFRIYRNDPLYTLLVILNMPSSMRHVSVFPKDTSGIYSYKDDDGDKWLMFSEDLDIHKNRCYPNVHIQLGDIYEADEDAYRFLVRFWMMLPEYVNTTEEKFNEEFYPEFNNRLGFERVLVRRNK